MGELLIDRFPAGDYYPPPSKSVGHRALICSALAGHGPDGFTPASVDLQKTMDGMRVITENTNDWIDCGDSASTMRFLLPIALAKNGIARMRGSERLFERSVAGYNDVFAQDGIQTVFEGNTLVAYGFLECGDYEVSGEISSQYLSGLLLALPLVPRDSRVRVKGVLTSRPYVGLTLDVMKAFGVRVCHEDFSVFHVPHKFYEPADFKIEADYSQAAFFLVAKALGADVRVMGLNPNSKQGDRRILDILESCGVNMRAVDIDAADIPDLVPILMVLLSFCNGKSRIFNTARLKLKESDRPLVMAQELNKMGADIQVRNNEILVQGVDGLRGAHVKANNDHRVAMALAVAAIRADGDVHIEGFESVEKSYPAFWADFCKVKR